MDLVGSSVLIVGGAGHVGSHLAATLADTADVTVVDDFSVGRREWVPDGVTVAEVDASDADALTPYCRDADWVFHLAVAEKDVAAAASDQLRANLDVTLGVADAAVAAGVERLVFTSSSTVYGEVAPRPTPEDYGPLAPISAYGAAKAAEEAVLSAATERGELSVAVARLANVVGPVFDGSVIPDFVEKLQADPTTLEILGDGRQAKSFVHVEDVADALVAIARQAEPPYDVYNVGTPDSVSIRRLADLVADELGLDPSYEFTGGDRGWSGDVPRMELDVSRLMDLGWSPTHGCEGAIRQAARQLAATQPAIE